MNIKPTADVLTTWIESYVPKKDFFFLSLDGMEKGVDFSDALIMPINEFYNHNTYSQISYINSYEYWNIKNAHYVVIAENEWIEQLSEADRAFILNE
ncbi:hypothetical protein [Solibacillus cecembensis]|uniref:hypothetical protein n=1 Tax=Solibacillus cecembensis TaxID=459347 RepID=UPI003D005BF9